MEAYGVAALSDMSVHHAKQLMVWQRGVNFKLLPGKFKHKVVVCCFYEELYVHLTMSSFMKFI